MEDNTNNLTSISKIRDLFLTNKNQAKKCGIQPLKTPHPPPLIFSFSNTDCLI